METRALAIALFYAVGTAVGRHQRAGALRRTSSTAATSTRSRPASSSAPPRWRSAASPSCVFGVRAEQQSLEDIARPLTAEDADGAEGGDGHEALRLRERAETERATAARHRAARHDAAAGLAPTPAAGLVVLEIRAQVAELRALALDALARGCDERAAGRRSASDAERNAALDRAARSDERARDYTERADALAAEHGVGSGQNGPAGAPGDGDDAETRWAQTRTARERALAARARHDEAAAAHEDKDARTHGHLALAAEERAEASSHDAHAARLHADAAGEEPAVRHRRAAERAARIDARRARQRDGMRRFRPGVGTVLFSPGMLGTAGPSSRFAAAAEAEHDREVEAIAQALADDGGADRAELLRRVGGRHWGPGRFTSALRAALREGRARRDAQGRYEASAPKPTG